MKQNKLLKKRNNSCKYKQLIFKKNIEKKHNYKLKKIKKLKYNHRMLLR